MPDDVPIGPQAGESAGKGLPAAEDRGKTQDRRRRPPEGEVRGGSGRVPEPPLEQTRREERSRGTKRAPG